MTTLVDTLTEASCRAVAQAIQVANVHQQPLCVEHLLNALVGLPFGDVPACLEYFNIHWTDDATDAPPTYNQARAMVAAYVFDEYLQSIFSQAQLTARVLYHTHTIRSVVLLDTLVELGLIRRGTPWEVLADLPLSTLRENYQEFLPNKEQADTVGVGCDAIVEHPFYQTLLLQHVGAYLSADYPYEYLLKDFLHRPEIQWVTDVIYAKDTQSVLLVNNNPPLRKLIVQGVAVKLNVFEKFQRDTTRIFALDCQAFCELANDEQELRSLFDRLLLALSQTSTLLFVDGMGEFFQAKDQSKRCQLFEMIQLAVLQQSVRVIFGVSPSQQATIDAQSFRLVLLEVQDLSAKERLCILNHEKRAIEARYQIEIPQRVISKTLKLVSRYTSPDFLYETCLQFLTIATSRIRQQHFDVREEGSVRILESHGVAEVIADWEQIPLSQLLLDENDNQSLEKYLQKYTLGQEIALSSLVSRLTALSQQTETELAPRLFLFAGPPSVGKLTTSRSLACYFNGHERFLIVVDFSLVADCHALEDILVSAPSAENRPMNLVQVVSHYPCVVLAFENVAQCPEHFMRMFAPILQTGFLCDEEGMRVDFRHVLFVVMAEVNVADSPECPVVATENLMSLVREEPLPPEEEQSAQLESFQTLVTQYHPLLKQHFSDYFLESSEIIPFVPLRKEVLEGIVREKLADYVERVHRHYALRVAYQPEVVSYLAQRMKALEESLGAMAAVMVELIDPCIAKFIQHAAPLNDDQFLMITLNDTGQLLFAHVVTESHLA